ncbi:MAG: prepilin-type N-terminal cleavage/methylation domain-containing protein [Gemmatimonadaceae bacterium]
MTLSTPSTSRTRQLHLQNRTTKRTPLRQSKGFTLVSMIVALILLAVGVGALANASAETLKSQTVAQNKTNAIAIGREYLEELRTRDAWTIQTEAPVNVNADGSASGDGKFSRGMILQIERQNLVRMTVTVNYPRMATPVVLTTFLFRGNGLTSAGP